MVRLLSDMSVPIISFLHMLVKKKGAKIMGMEKIRWIFCVLLLALVIWVILRREMCKRKIRHMGKGEKQKKLSELAAPFGFLYDVNQDIFVSRIHAWQRNEGYEALFDKLAPNFNMIMDCFPVYFDYRNKTWLIEFWKGQYGINTGAEAGVYHANRIIPKNQRSRVHYNAVSDEEMPLIGICLEKQGQKLFSIKKYHWWLAAFRMGMFSQPEELVMYATVTFSDASAAEAFGQGLQEAGCLRWQYRVRGRRVVVMLKHTCESAQNGRKIVGLHRKFVQCMNRFYCRIYRIVTYPFHSTEDRMLFLYEQLPWCFRRMLGLHSFGRKVRVKK